MANHAYTNVATHYNHMYTVTLTMHTNALDSTVTAQHIGIHRSTQ